MSDEKPVNSADDLTKTKKPSDIQLNEEELSKVSGGLKITFQEVFITSIPINGGGDEPTPTK